MSIPTINAREFDSCISKLRKFCSDEKGLIEVHTQSRLTILAACEDPRTISTYNYAGQIWPLSQTGQMILEEELLNDPDAPGFFCVSTSYRNEPTPVPGRHDLIFPMMEFEFAGDLSVLEQFERELMEYLGFGDADSFPGDDYKNVAEMYGVSELEGEHELRMQKEHGDVFFLRHFPQYTSPFWNMKKTGDVAEKIDVIVHGIETIGSAERSTDPEEMNNLFHSISDGMYADILYAQFTKERVEKELDAFLSHSFFPRCGGGIGITRMLRSLRLQEQKN